MMTGTYNLCITVVCSKTYFYRPKIHVYASKDCYIFFYHLGHF